MNISLLRSLCETPGIPGREERVRDLVKKNIKGLFDTVTTDPREADAGADLLDSVRASR